MISETAFIGCRNLPEGMACRFDVPWVFVGEIKTDKRLVATCCQKCNQSELVLVGNPCRAKYKPLVVVSLRGYRFITDDMIEVMVYFGTCEKCGSVYWARSGAPFRRVRTYVSA